MTALLDSLKWNWNSNRLDRPLTLRHRARLQRVNCVGRWPACVRRDCHCATLNTSSHFPCHSYSLMSCCWRYILCCDLILRSSLCFLFLNSYKNIPYDFDDLRNANIPSLNRHTSPTDKYLYFVVFLFLLFIIASDRRHFCLFIWARLHNHVQLLC